MGLLDTIFGGSDAQQPQPQPQPADNLLGGYAQWRAHNPLAAMAMAGKQGGIFAALGSLLGEDAYSRPAFLQQQLLQGEALQKTLVPTIVQNAMDEERKKQQGQGGAPTDAPATPASAQPPGMTDPTAYQRATGVGGMAPAPSAPLLAPSAPAAPAPTAGGNLLGGLRMPAGMSIPSLLATDLVFGQGTAGKILAGQYPGPTDAERAVIAAGLDPRSPQGQAMLATAATDKVGVKPFLGGERPGVPLLQFNPQTGKYEIALSLPPPIPGASIQMGPNGQPGFVRAPGADFNMGANAGIEAGAKVFEHGANARTDFGLKYGTPAPGGGSAFPGFTPSLGTGAPAPAAPAQPAGPMTPAPAGPVAREPVPAPAASKPVQSPQGTLIPPVKEQGPMPHGGAEYDAAIPAWQKLESEWQAAQGPAQEAEQRLKTIAEAYKLTESGSFATNKAAIGAAAKSLGINLPSDWTGNVAAVQTALHENAVQTLQRLKATTSRFTQMEFKTLSGQTEHPDLQPEANLQMLAEDTASLRQAQQLPQDWQQARKLMWRDPVAFESAWRRANPLGPVVSQVKQEIGPLKGMPGAAGEIDPEAARAELRRRGVAQ